MVSDPIASNRTDERVNREIIITGKYRTIRRAEPAAPAPSGGHPAYLRRTAPVTGPSPTRPCWGGWCNDT
jgi:hypothetical protein